MQIFRQGEGRRRDDSTGGREGQQLEGESGSLHILPPAALVGALLQPTEPIRDCVVVEAVDKRLREGWVVGGLRLRVAVPALRQIGDVWWNER